MKREFLFVKYAGVKSPDQIRRGSTDVGWKCRKYQKWTAVQNEPTDRSLLKKVGDSLVEDGELDLSLYGALSAVFLNVQKWRIDPENLSADPPNEPAWERANALLEAACENPNMVVQWLRRTGMQIGQAGSASVILAFHVRVLAEMLSELGLLNRNLAEAAHATVDAAVADWQFWRSACLPAYELVGLKLPSLTSTEALVKAALLDMGLPDRALSVELTIVDQAREVANSRLSSVVLRYDGFDPVQLIKITSSKGFLLVCINKLHPFTKANACDGRLAESVETMLRAYALTYGEMASMQDRLDTFTAYFSLELHRCCSSQPK